MLSGIIPGLYSPLVSTGRLKIIAGAVSSYIRPWTAVIYVTSNVLLLCVVEAWLLVKLGADRMTPRPVSTFAFNPYPDQCLTFFNRHFLHTCGRKFHHNLYTTTFGPPWLCFFPDSSFFQYVFHFSPSYFYPRPI